MKRRTFIKQTISAGVGLAAVSPFINSNAYKLFADSQKRYSDRAINLVSETTVIDMLSQFGDTQEEIEQWLSSASSFTEADYLKYQTSGVNVFGYGAGADNYQDMLVHIARWNSFIATNSRYIERIDTVEKLSSINASDKIGILMTYQDSEHFRTVEDVDSFYGLGQRVSQLTYNPQNRLGCGAFVDKDTGLTDFGVSVTERMNQIGMAVDLSHCGDRTTLDALSVSKQPVLFTHAACRALNPGYARAKTDEALTRMAATGGVVGMPILRFMVRDREPVNVGHFIDHIDYAVKLLGIEHVGIGSDQNLDTEDALPLAVRKNTIEHAPPKYEVHTNKENLLAIEGINHPKRIFDITEELIQRNYTDSQIKLILGGNFKRVLTEIFNVKKRDYI